VTDLPLAVGFGIATPADVARALAPEGDPAAGADAAIVGSAIVKAMRDAAAQGASPAEAARSLAERLHPRLSLAGG
jgi:tryptophan synthase alpha subunit